MTTKRGSGHARGAPLLIGHFTVMDGSEAGVDLVLMQTFLLHYLNEVILMLTSIFSRTTSITKQRRFVSEQGRRQLRIHPKARLPSPQLQNGLLRAPSVFTSPT